MIKKEKKKIFKKWYAVGLISFFMYGCKEFTYPLLLNKIQSYIDERKIDREKVVRIWNTLQEANEISDPENKGPNSELIIALRTISDTEKKVHPAIWEKHVKGTENYYDQFLNKLEVVVKINHRATYDLVALRQGAHQILAKANVSESWNPSELPVELTGLAYGIASINDDSQNAPLLPYIMIEGWNYQREVELSKSNSPVIDLSNPKIQAILAKIAQEKGSKELAQLAAQKTGLLIPVFGKDPKFQKCFKYEFGIVEINAKIDSCKQLAQKYFETAKASTEFSKITSTVCKADLITFNDSNIDIDPCAQPGTYAASTVCYYSVAAYVRKLIRDPKAKDETHKKFLLEKCQEEIKMLPKIHRQLFE